MVGSVPKTGFATIPILRILNMKNTDGRLIIKINILAILVWNSGSVKTQTDSIGPNTLK